MSNIISPLYFEAPPKNAILYVNVRARRGEKWLRRAPAMLRERGIQLDEVQAFRSKDAMLAAIRSALAREVPLIILGGGDGTFGSVDHDFAHQRSVLGVLPMGTGNAFARDLGIRTDLAHACDVIASGKVSRVDLGLVDDQHFLNVATIGLTTAIARGLKWEIKRIAGPFAYLFSLWRALKQTYPFDVQLTIPGEPVHEFRSLQVVLGNGRFHGGPFLLAHDAHIQSGQLLIYALESTRKSAFFRLAFALQFARHVDLPEVRVFRASAGQLITDRPKTVTVDGELILKTPIRFGVDPKSLQVITPRDFGTIDERG